jgi:hypothetical protein
MVCKDREKYLYEHLLLVFFYFAALLSKMFFDTISKTSIIAMKSEDKKEGGKCFVWFTYSPLSFLKRGGRGG